MNFKNFILISFFLFTSIFNVNSQTNLTVAINTNGLIKSQEVDGSDSLICSVIHPEILFTSDGLIHYVGFDNEKESISLINSTWIEVQRKISSGQTLLYKSVAFPVELTDKENVIGFWDSQKTVLAVQFSLIPKSKQQISRNLQSSSSNESTTGYLTNLPFSTGRWVKVKVTEEGVYSIKKSDLSRFGFSGSEDGTKLQVYSSSGKNAGLLGTTEISIWTKNTEQPEISDDQVYYFFTSINKGIDYNTGLKKFAHYIDIYDDSHYIFIGFGSQNGKRVSTADYSNLSSTVTYTEGKDLIWEEQEKENLIKSGTRWLGQSLIENSSIVLTPKLPDYKPGTTIEFQTKVVSRRSFASNARFNIYDHDVRLISDLSTQYVDLGSYESSYASEKTAKSVIQPVSEDRLKLKYEFPSNTSAIGWIDWFEAEYTKTLLNSKNEISFYQPTSINTDALIKLSGFNSSNIHIININDDLNPIKVAGTINAGDVEFKWPLLNNKGNRFFVFDNVNGVKTLGSFSVLPNFGFSGINSQTNYIIIAPDVFYNSALRLLEHRNNQGWNGVVVKLENIYEAYSGGKKSIYGIKQFLKEISIIYSKTAANVFNVLLFGDTSYDYKGIINTSQYKCIIPAYESDESFVQSYSYASDDFYSTLFQSNKYEIGIGRLPVTSVSEAESMVEKLIDYDTKSDYGDWRNTITYVADDGLTDKLPGDDDLHTSNAETVGNAPFVPKTLNKNKIYLINYPTEYGSEGRRKPGVTKDLISALNSGTAIMNYSGHGNSKVWTHERVLEISTFLPRLSNLSVLPFIITATCDFGKYDDDDIQSAAELLVLKPDGGAVGMLTTTRLVSTSRSIDGTYNLAINYALFRFLFNKDAKGNNLSVGEIYKLTKNRIGVSDDNVQKFALLADPAMRLLLPGTASNLTKHNGLYGQTDSLKIKSQSLTSLSGEVYKNDGTLNFDFNGEIAFRLKSEPRTITIPEWSNFSFELEGQDVFRGTSSVVNGKFSTQFIVPKDVTVNQKSAKISGYYWNQSHDGFLNTPKVYFETNSDFIQTDTTGPDVHLFLNESSFVNGQIVSSNSEIVADISDSSGVNTTGLGIGHQLLGILDNNINESFDLSNYYSAAKDDFRRGKVKFPVTSLTPGLHSFEIRVWDSFNNGSVKKVDFTIGNNDELSVENLLPYPNPFSEKVQIYFNHNQTDGVFKISAKIYTSNGLLINSIKKDVSSSNNADFIEWDGIDSDGDHVANGIYLINVSIEDQKSGKRIHKIAKVFYLK